MHKKYFQVAGITVELRSDYPIGENTLHPKFRQFEVDGPGTDTVLIHHHFINPDLRRYLPPNAKELYNKEQWKIYRTDNSWVYSFTSMLPIDPANSAFGVFNHDYTTLSVYSDDFSEEDYQTARLTALTLFNNDQVMFAPLLSERNGLIIHSNGFDINGNGILLVGTSGAGKSTLSRMLKKKGYRILCDDRMFITQIRPDFRIHGNWCHGTVPDSASGSVPLKALLFLQQGTENSIEKIHDRIGTVHHCLRALVQPLLTPDGWEKTFDIIEAMAKQVTCYHVKFDLSGDICHIISDLFNNMER